MTKVGFVGAGRMGMPMIERIAAAGMDLTVFVRRAEVAETVAAAGIDLAGSVEELAAMAEVLCVCTFDDAQLREVAFGASGVGGALAALRPGAVLVNHTTGSPALAEELAVGAPAGVGVVDAPVSGTADQIRSGVLTVLVGATAEHLEMVRPVLATYASTVLHVGGVGDAQRIKLVNNLVFTVHLQVAALASELGRSLGIEPDVLARALQHCSGTSLPFSMLEQIPLNAALDGARPFLAKDTAVIRDVARDLGVDLGPLGDLAEWVDGVPSDPPSRS